MQLAALDDGVVEDVGHGAAQSLGTVEHDQDRPRRVQAALAQPGEQVTDHGGALGQPDRDPGPVQGDPQGDHAAVVGDLNAVDHERDQVQAGQVGGQQLG